MNLATAAFGNGAHPPCAGSKPHYRVYNGQDITWPYEPQVSCQPYSCPRSGKGHFRDCEGKLSLATGDLGHCGFISVTSPANSNHPRDFWNLTLEQRQYLLCQPPLHFPQIPQSSRPCTYAGTIVPVLSDRCEWQVARKYYLATAQGQEAVPGLVVAPWPPVQPCSCLPLRASHPRVPAPLPARGTVPMPNSCLTAELATVASPAVSGVKFHVDRNSALRLDSYRDFNDLWGAECQRGFFPAEMDTTACTKPDTDGSYRGAERPAPFCPTYQSPEAAKGTCRPFRNVTRRKNLIDQVAVDVLPNGLIIDHSPPLYGYNRCSPCG